MLKKFYEIWDKVSNIIKNEFSSDPVYSNKYLKTKIKSYDEKVNTSFYNDKMPKGGAHCICLSVVLIDFVFKMGKNYYPQVFSEECNYIVKESGVTKYINEDLENSSTSDESGEE